MITKHTRMLAATAGHVLAAALPWTIVLSAYQLVLGVLGTDAFHMGLTVFSIGLWISAAAYIALLPPAIVLPIGELVGQYLVLQLGLTMLLGSLFFDSFANSAGLPEQIQMLRDPEFRLLAGGVGAAVVAIQTFRIVASSRRAAERNRVFAALTTVVPSPAAKEITENLLIALKGDARTDLPKAEAVIAPRPDDRG
jgi:hypothetical protein